MHFNRSLVTIIFVTLFLFSAALAQKNFSNCTAKGCHLTQKKFDNIHSPVEDGCSDCHVTESDKHPVQDEIEFKLTTKMPELCFDCHDTYANTGNLHSPVEDGDCKSCHNPHSSDNEFLLKAELGTVCADCHDDVVGDGEMIHGPVAGDMCNACHDPHLSALPTLLVREGMDLCLYCHENKKKCADKTERSRTFPESLFAMPSAS